MNKVTKKKSRIFRYALCSGLVAISFFQLGSDTKKEIRKNLELDKKVGRVFVKENERAKLKSVVSLRPKEDLMRKLEVIRSKAILSKSERSQLDNYLTDSKIIRTAYLTLISKDFTSIDSSIEKRINATNYLMDGLQRTTIDRSEILKNVEMFLLSTNEEETENLDIRRAIIGDKVDLYNALIQYAPKEAERFKTNYLSDRLRKVIQYVELNNKRNRG